MTAGRALSIGGLAAVTAGGFLGRHLAYPLGAGTSHAEPVAHLAPLGWHELCMVGHLPDGRAFRVADGSVVHGPATARQPAFEVRVSDTGTVQVRPRKPRRDQG